ncbi:unnamed protein product [Phytophthora lilii]|uniref:Unnamed protein product n=1 Tax=Phytophthora lilii TaxID=2077276 RepID=A0A9W6X277_9STRA|nr:unnamed protein product [Phytophthora lilii]
MFSGGRSTDILLHFLDHPQVQHGGRLTCSNVVERSVAGLEQVTVANSLLASYRSCVLHYDLFIPIWCAKSLDVHERSYKNYEGIGLTYSGIFAVPKCNSFAEDTDRNCSSQETPLTDIAHSRGSIADQAMVFSRIKNCRVFKYTCNASEIFACSVDRHNGFAHCQANNKVHHHGWLHPHDGFIQEIRAIITTYAVAGTGANVMEPKVCFFSTCQTNTGIDLFTLVLYWMEDRGCIEKFRIRYAIGEY